jgi:hypothetical protein
VEALRRAGVSPGGLFWATVSLKAELVALGTWVRERLGDTPAAEAVLDDVVRGAQRWMAPGGLAGDVALVLGATGGGAGAEAQAEAPAEVEAEVAARRLARRLNWRPPTDTIAGAALDLALRRRAARAGQPPDGLVRAALARALARAGEELELGDLLPHPARLIERIERLEEGRPFPRWPTVRDAWRRLADAAVATVVDDLAREPTPPGWERLVVGLLVPDSGPGHDRGRRGRPPLLPRADKRRVLGALVQQAMQSGAPLELLTLDLVAELLDEACARGALRVEGRRLMLPAPVSDHALDPELNRRRRRERLRQWLADVGLPRWGEARVALALPATDVLSDIELSNG